MAKKEKSLLQWVKEIIKALGDPKDLKSTLALIIAVVTTAWTLMGIQGMVRDLAPQVDSLVSRAAALQERVKENERDLEALEKELDALEQSRTELNQVIRRAVERGIRKGVTEALERLNDGPK